MLVELLVVVVLWMLFDTYMPIMPFSLWSMVYSFVPYVIVPFIMGTSWSDWPEGSRKVAIFYALCAWGSCVVAYAFRSAVGRWVVGGASICSMN